MTARQEVSDVIMNDVKKRAQHLKGESNAEHRTTNQRNRVEVAIRRCAQAAFGLDKMVALALQMDSVEYGHGREDAFEIAGAAAGGVPVAGAVAEAAIVAVNKGLNRRRENQDIQAGVKGLEVVLSLDLRDEDLVAAITPVFAKYIPETRQGDKKGNIEIFGTIASAFRKFSPEIIRAVGDYKGDSKEELLGAVAQIAEPHIQKAVAKSQKKGKGQWTAMHPQKSLTRSEGKGASRASRGA